MSLVCLRALVACRLASHGATQFGGSEAGRVSVAAKSSRPRLCLQGNLRLGQLHCVVKVERSTLTLYRALPWHSPHSASELWPRFFQVLVLPSFLPALAELASGARANTWSLVNAILTVATSRCYLSSGG